MLISHIHSFIYLKTAKTAGTSVESFFEKFCMPVGEWRPSHSRDLYESPSGIIGHRGPNANTKKWYNHMPADLVRQSIHEDTWNNYFKFCTIRDPFEKCISGFVWHGKKFRNSGKNFNSSKCLNMNVFWRDSFLEYLIEEAPDHLIDRGIYTLNGELCMDFFIRFEFLQDDVKKVCRSLNLPFDPACLPKFKSGARPVSFTVGNLYTREAIEIVSKMYEFEIGVFDYKPPKSV